MNVTRARIIAKLAHRGQMYGDLPYFEGHIEKVVARCEENKQCTYGIIVVAYLHDIVEDTVVDFHDLRVLGLGEGELVSIETLTRRDGESYAAYIDKIVSSDDTVAQFVKYYDLVENRSNCLNKTSAHYGSLVKRYDVSLNVMRRSNPYFLYEESADFKGEPA